MGSGVTCSGKCPGRAGEGASATAIPCEAMISVYSAKRIPRARFLIDILAKPGNLRLRKIHLHLSHHPNPVARSGVKAGTLSSARHPPAVTQRERASRPLGADPDTSRSFLATCFNHQ